MLKVIKIDNGIKRGSWLEYTERLLIEQFKISFSTNVTNNNFIKE